MTTATTHPILMDNGSPIFQPLLEQGFKYDFSGHWWITAQRRTINRKALADATGIPAADLLAWENATDLEQEAMDRDEL